MASYKFYPNFEKTSALLPVIKNGFTKMTNPVRNAFATRTAPIKDAFLKTYIKINHGNILGKLQSPSRPGVSLQSFGGLAHLAGQGVSALSGGIGDFSGGGGMFGGGGSSGAW